MNLNGFTSFLCDIFMLLNNDKINYKSKVKLAKDYIRIKFKSHFNSYNYHIKKERLLDFNINFFSYQSLLFLIKEIFFEFQYFSDSYEKLRKKQLYIVDCGSNIGLSILFFKYLYPNSKIIAFEPDPVAFTILKRNIEINKLQNICLENKGVYSKTTELNFYYHPEIPAALTMSIRKKRISKTKKIKIKTISLSSIINQEIDILKLDIEGAEMEVIEELAKNNKLSLIREIFIEYHHHIQQNKDELSKFLKILEDNNFSYQLTSSLKMPWKQNIIQDILIYAYQKK